MGLPLEVLNALGGRQCRRSGASGAPPETRWCDVRLPLPSASLPNRRWGRRHQRHGRGGRILDYLHGHERGALARPAWTPARIASSPRGCPAQRPTRSTMRRRRAGPLPISLFARSGGGNRRRRPRGSRAMSRRRSRGSWFFMDHERQHVGRCPSGRGSARPYRLSIPPCLRS